MRITRTSVAETDRERAITALIALADTGQRQVEIRKVLGWLGVEWRDGPVSMPAPPPGADPITGCAPVARP